MKKVFLVLFILPLLSMAQKAVLWKVDIKNKPIEWQMVNDTATINLKKVKKGSLVMHYLYPEKVKNSNQSIIVMDEERKELNRVKVDSSNKAIIDIKLVFAATKQKTVYLYSITVSKDSKLMNRVRVGTVFIGRVSFSFSD